METLTQRSVEIQRRCDACGLLYDAQERKKAIQRIPTPNTADRYCTDRCWARGTSTTEQ